MGTTSLCPWSRRRGSTRIFLRPSSTGGPGTSFVSRDEWETPSDDFLGEVHRLLRRWKALGLGALPSNFSLIPSSPFFFKLFTKPPSFLYLCS